MSRADSLLGMPQMLLATYIALLAAPIRFQKHCFLEGRDGKKNPCPIEYRNIFIKEIKPSE